MNQLLHIISWGSRYFNYPIIPTDPVPPASVVMGETTKQCSKGRVHSGKMRRYVSLFPLVRLPIVRGSRDPREVIDGIALSTPCEPLSLLASWEGTRLFPGPL